MPTVHCELCGHSASSISNLTAGMCQRHPAGACKGAHQLYEGSEKSKYSCKYCGHSAASITNLTQGMCQRHPDGKGHHAPSR